MNFVFLGPPGAGKGTQSKLICEKYNLTQLSTGDILRDNYRRGTELGKTAAKYWADGGLVPDEIMIDLVDSELNKHYKTQGFIFDGFPRTIPQADALENLLHKHNMRLDLVLVLDVNMKELVRRLSARRTCTSCGKTYHLDYNPPKNHCKCDLDDAPLYQREDDREEAITNRLQIFHDQTFLLEEYYNNRGMAYHIYGMDTPEDIFNNIKRVLNKFVDM